MPRGAVHRVAFSGFKVRRLRTARDLTAADVARVACIPFTRYLSIESGVTEPQFSEGIAIARAIGVAGRDITSGARS